MKKYGIKKGKGERFCQRETVETGKEWCNPSKLAPTKGRLYIHIWIRINTLMHTHTHKQTHIHILTCTHRYTHSCVCVTKTERQTHIHASLRCVLGASLLCCTYMYYVYTIYAFMCVWRWRGAPKRQQNRSHPLLRHFTVWTAWHFFFCKSKLSALMCRSVCMCVSGR